LGKDKVFGQWQKSPMGCTTPSRCNLAGLDAAVASKAFVVIDDTRFELNQDEILGRCGSVGAQIFRRDVTVSRDHARIWREMENWHVANISPRNTVQLESPALNLALKPNDKTALAAGSYSLRLGPSFLVRLTIE
jgi:hypothetical protein